jgi:uncharacterized protein
MIGNKRRISLSGEKPLFQAFIALLIIIGFGSVLTLVFFIIGLLIFGNGTAFAVNPAAIFDGTNIGFMRYLMAVQDVTLFIIPSILILILLKAESDKTLPGFRTFRINEAILVVILAFCIFPVTGFTGGLNSSMHFPDWLSGVEKWMISKENKADNITELLIEAKSPQIMLLNILIIAVLPAIGEELVFRGVFQKIFTVYFRSGHLAIWITAFIFSFVHLQFFGFIPRMILGVVFGYLFYWSGSIWLPVLAHFINNAFPVIVTYFQGTGVIKESADISLWSQAAILPLPVVTGIVILYYFRNKFREGKGSGYVQTIDRRGQDSD